MRRWSTNLLLWRQRQHSLLKFSTLLAFLPTASTLQVLNTSQHFQHLLSLLLFLTSPYLQRQHFKFSTLQVLNTSSISCHCFCFPHLLTYSVNTSSSQHFSTLPAFLVITSVSHISYLRFSNRAWACWGKHLSPFHLHIIGNQVDLGSFHKQYFFWI